MGPTPTLPPNPQPPPANRDRRSRALYADPSMDLVMGVGVDPATGDVARQPDLADDLEPGEIDRRIRELAEADRTTHPQQEPEPLGRRLPPALDTAREGVER